MVARKKSSNSVADYFIALSNETGSLISNLKLQKLVYYADAWYLANYNTALVEEDFEAWVHGPVVPALYARYREFGWQPIIRDDLTAAKFHDILGEFDHDTKQLLELVTDAYFGLSAFELERLTHNEDPWKMARLGLAADMPSDRIIDKELMKEYYRSFIRPDVAEDQQAKGQ